MIGRRPSGSLPDVPDPTLDAWMTSSAGPFLTMNAGGLLEGVVTIAVATEGSDQLLVEAAWKCNGNPGQHRRPSPATTPRGRSRINGPTNSPPDASPRSCTQETPPTDSATPPVP